MLDYLLLQGQDFFLDGGCTNTTHSISEPTAVTVGQEPLKKTRARNVNSNLLHTPPPNSWMQVASPIVLMLSLFIGLENDLSAQESKPTEIKKVKELDNANIAKLILKLNELYKKVYAERSIFKKSEIINSELKKALPIKYKQIKEALKEINQESGLALKLVSLKKDLLEIVIINSFYSEIDGKSQLAKNLTPVRIGLNLSDLLGNNLHEVLKNKWSKLQNSKQYKLFKKDLKLKIDKDTHLVQATDYKHHVGTIYHSLKSMLLHKKYYQINSVAEPIIDYENYKMEQEYLKAKKALSDSLNEIDFVIPHYNEDLSDPLNSNSIAEQLRSELKRAIDSGKQQILIKYGAHGDYDEYDTFALAFGQGDSNMFSSLDFLDVLSERYKGKSLGNQIDIVVVCNSCKSSDFANQIVEVVSFTPEFVKEKGLEDPDEEALIFKDDIRNLVIYSGGDTNILGILDKEKISINNTSKSNSEVLKEIGLSPEMKIELKHSLAQWFKFRKVYEAKELYSVSFMENYFQVYCQILEELEAKGIDTSKLSDNYLNVLRFMDIMSQGDSERGENHEGVMIKVQGGRATVERFS